MSIVPGDGAPFRSQTCPRASIPPTPRRRPARGHLNRNCGTPSGSLPERQRTALALRYVADLEHAEIARVLDTTPTATRRLVSDALASLRRDLVPQPAAASGAPTTAAHQAAAHYQETS